MSIYSTDTVTREYALRKIKQQVDEMNNEQLADLLFEVYGKDHFANYFVVNKLDSDDD